MKYTTDNREVTIDLNRDELLPEASMQVLKDKYLIGDEKSPQEAFARASCAYSDNSSHAQRLYDYASKQWFMFATPVLSNAGSTRGLPISCFLNFTEDSIGGLAKNFEEDMWMSVKGGGIGTYFGAVRSIGTPTNSGNKTTGAIAFMKNIDSLMLSCHQGSTRRGSCAMYMDVSHPEIEEFIIMRKPSGGDYNRKNLNLHHGINLTDEFMHAVLNNEDYNLIDPHTRGIKKTVKARDIWREILTARIETGEPYLHFVDTSNRMLPKALKDKGLKIHGSNLCSEIFLPTTPDRTAVCCLSSVNAAKYNEWKNNTDFVSDLMRMLDNVLQVFIDNAPPELWRAVNSAKSERSVGLGMMGFHSFLQQSGIPFESPMALSWSENIIKNIYQKALQANFDLAEERGEAPDMEGTGRRFAHMLAVAPNASSGIICGTVSPSIEPYNSNAYNQKTSSGDFLIKNKELKKVLRDKYDKDTRRIWDSIIANDGSVQHLKFMDDSDKAVFKTAHEIHQGFIVEHAARRQPFICQGQSVNVFFDSNVDISYINRVHFDAWAKGLKALYYCRSKSIQRAENVSGNTEENKPQQQNEPTQSELPQDECLMCQG